MRKKPLLERVISRNVHRDKTFIKRLQISIAVALIGHLKGRIDPLDQVLGNVLLAVSGAVVLGGSTRHEKG